MIITARGWDEISLALIERVLSESGSSTKLRKFLKTKSKHLVVDRSEIA